MAGVNLQGWDAVNAAVFDTVNAAIAKAGTSPKTFTLTKSGMFNTAINGSFGAWTLVSGGAGATLAVALPISTGTASYDMTERPTLDPKTIGAHLSLDATKLAVTGVTVTPSIGSAFGTFGAQTGKYYFEITHTNVGTGAERVFVGIAPATAFNADYGRDPKAYAYNSDGFTFNNNVQGQFAAATGTARGEVWNSTGATVGVAVDFDNARIWFRGPTGTWQGVNADPATGAVPAYTIDTSAPLTVAVALLGTGTATLNVGDSPFKHAVPSGFSSGFSRTATTRVTLDGATVAGTIRLAKVPGNGTEVNLLPDNSPNTTNPPTSVSDVTLSNGTAAVPPIQAAFDAWLAANIATFTNIFHTIDIGGAASQPNPTPAGGGAAPANNFAWLAPTGFAYAAVDEPGVTPAKSVLSILTMTEKRTSNTLAAQVSPAIISNMPAGSNAVLAISPQRVAEKILWPALMSIAGNTDNSNFELDALGTAVTNKVAIDWRPITLDNGTVVTPKIPAKGISLGIEGRSLRLRFSGLSFDYPGVVLVGKETITFSFSQVFYLTVEKRTDGKSILAPSFKDPNDPTSTDEAKVDDLVMSATLDPSAQAFTYSMLAFGIILSILTIGLVVGTVIRAAAAEAGVAQSAAGRAAAQGTGDAIYGSTSLAQYGAPPAVAQAQAEAEQAAADAYGALQLRPAAGGCLGFLARPAVRLAIGAVFAGAFGGAAY